MRDTFTQWEVGKKDKWHYLADQKGKRIFYGGKNMLTDAQKIRIEFLISEMTLIKNPLLLLGDLMCHLRNWSKW